MALFVFICVLFKYVLEMIFGFISKQEKWKHEPFAATKEENGDIYARGTQVKD